MDQPKVKSIEPTWSKGGCELYLGDCLEILPQLEAGSPAADRAGYHVPDAGRMVWL